MPTLKRSASTALAAIALLFAWIPAYYVNLLIAVPAGLLAYGLYRSDAAARPGRWFDQLAPTLLGLAAVLFVGSWLLVR